jgi:RHS repeat-associated protein
LTNGGLSLRLALAAFPQRGNLDLSFMVRFSNKQWHVYSRCSGQPPHQTCTHSWVPVSSSGAQIVSSVDWVMQSSYAVEPGDPNISSQPAYDWSQGVSGPDGGSHQFGGGIASLIGPSYPLRSLDATGILHTNAQTVILPNGTVYSYPSLWDGSNTSTLSGGRGGVQASSVTDANGNQITINSSGWTDTMGRVIPGSANLALFKGVQPGVPTSDLSTCPSGTSSAMVWNVPGVASVDSGVRTFKFCYAMFTLATNFPPGYATNHSATSVPLLSAVVLPDHLSMWTFSYDSYGDITRLGFPTGGSVSYTYAFGPLNCNTGTSNSMWVTSRTVDANDGTGGHTWSYNYSGQLSSVYIGNGQYQQVYSGTTTVTSPDGHDTVHSIASLPSAGCSQYDVQTQYFQGSAASGSLLKTVQTQYDSTPDTTGTNADGQLAFNVVPTQITMSWPTGQSSKTVNAYDALTPDPENQMVRIGSLLQNDEYDFSNTLVRSTINHYLWQDNATYKSNNFVSLLVSSIIKTGAGCEVAKTSHAYDETYNGIALQSSGITTQHGAAPWPVRGNPTSSSKWLVSACAEQSAVTSHSVPYDTGLPYQAFDPLGHFTQYTYSSAFAGAYVTQTNLPDTGAPVVHHVISGNYDFNTGLLTSFTDENSQQYTYTYDNMLRLTQGNHPDGGQTIFTYPDPLTVTRQHLITTGVYDNFTAKFDGLGRSIQTQHLTPSGTALADTTYNTVGHVATVSNPYYQGSNHSSDPTYGVTQTLYDALGRATTTTRQDGSIATVAYAGNCTTATDEAGKQRKACSDALGRLTNVWEDPSGVDYETDYQYDTLGNLLRVDQKGSAPADSTKWRTRLFTYNSLSQLLTANNPESGTISYTYDADGNLLQKTSPQANQTGSATTTISFCYDALHRVTGRAYTAQACPLTTPVVTYAYDAGTNAKGHLSSLTDQAGSGSYNYDNMGHISSEQRTIAGVSKTLSYDYNLDGSVKAVHYPSGAAVTYTPDSAGRILSAVDTANATNYVTSATYGPDSALTGFINGNTGSFAGINNTFSYNKRLQPINMSASSPGQTVFSIGYDFHVGNGTSGADNGNVWGITNYKDNTRNQSFTYDALNRLTSAQNAGTNCATTTVNGKTEYWGNSYGYDAWGNLLAKTVTKCGAENLTLTAAVNNQLQGGYTYDAAGNMTHDATSSLNYSYDQENRITGAGGYTYTYDGDGNRVEKSSGSTGTLYWYMTPGIVGESDLSGNLTAEYVFFGGERVARKDFPGGAVSYYFSDHLKTASVITDSVGNIKSELDYYPWGGELQFINNDSNHYKFTGKERDSESGLDYFGARYYSNGLGRFISADWSATPIPVPYADFGDPQTLNQYTYVRNLPTTKIDADGHCCAPYELADAIDSVLDKGNQTINNSALAFGGPPALAGAVSFTNGFSADVAKGFTNLLRLGQSVGSLPEGSSTTDKVIAGAEEGGRVGGIILAVVGVAGPKTPASAESGAQVAGDIGKNRVTLSNGSKVDVAGKTHFEKTTQQSVPTPHIKDATLHTGPTGSSVTYGPTRPATVGDVNAAARTAGATPPVRIPPPLPVPKKENQ